MSAQRTERLLNLVIALLATKRWLTKEQLRQAVPQYAACASTEAFDRMFERDKDELRELGVPIETGSHDAAFDDEQGYRVDPDAYALAPITFTPAELTVLGLAARVWRQASLAGPAARGLVKLKALGITIDDSSLVGIEPRVTTTEPAFGGLYQATRDGAPVRFEYLKDGDTEPTRRTIEPWRIVSWHGRWYVHGFDRDRGEPRVFRLSRIRGPVRRVGEPGSVSVPPEVDSRAAVRRVWGEGAPRTARLAVEPQAALMLRRRAAAAADAPEFEIQFGDLDSFAGEVAALGSRAIVLEPDDLRAAVVTRLGAAEFAHSQPVDPALQPAALQPTDSQPTESQRTDSEPTDSQPADTDPGHRPPTQPVPHPQPATDRLSRLLAMVPYLVERQGIDLADAARHFDLTQDALVADLQLLFVCGLPGHMPDDLIEAEWESGRVYLDNADAIARPLRLGMDEAVALLAGLRTLADAPGAADIDALVGAQAKLVEATGEAGAAAGAVAVTLDDESDSTLLAQVREAVSTHRRVHLSYVVPGRDEATERDVDPMRVVSLSGHWYLEGWCHRAEDVRLFRLSRVLELVVRDQDGTPPADATARDLDVLFVPSQTDLVLTLKLAPESAWVVEAYQASVLAEPALGSGAGLIVQIRAADTGWLRQLALRSGGTVQVLAPAGVAADVAAEARAALQRYS